MFINARYNLIALVIFLSPFVYIQAQSGNKETDLKNIGRSYAAAKAKVSMNERKVAVADSLIEAGNRLVDEAKSETRTINEERNKLDKGFSARQKPLTRLLSSKDKAEAGRSRAELKELTIKYRSDAKVLDNRLKDARKKLTKGNSNLTKGKSARESARNSLKTSQSLLKSVQAKYDAVYFNGGSHDPNTIRFK